MSACSNCRGNLGLSPCAHGDSVERAYRALAHVTAERAAAQLRKERGLPANLQEAGEAYEIAGKREGISATYVRLLDKIEASGRRDLITLVRSRTKRIDEVAQNLIVPGSKDDPDTWISPKRVIEPARLEAGGKFHLDVATISGNPTDARDYYAKDRGQDGLKSSWRFDSEERLVHTIWINPPYSDITPWLEKAYETAREFPDIAIWMLIPANTDTVYGQYALRRASAICFLNKRVRHLRADGSPQGSPKFGSMVVGFGAATLRHYHDLGVVYPNAPMPGSVFRRNSVADASLCKKPTKALYQPSMFDELCGAA